jgi:hypothetical protein
MHLADVYAHESMKGNEYDNRAAIAEARKALLEALTKALYA